MSIHFHGLPSAAVADLRATGRDAYDAPVIRQISTGKGTPCRHCLQTVPVGAPFLILAWRPFEEASAYAETGPIFLCAEPCEAASPAGALPPMLEKEIYTLRPYDRTPRIRYGHEEIVAREALQSTAARMLEDPETAFVDVRNPHTGCYQCRIERA